MKKNLFHIFISTLNLIHIFSLILSENELLQNEGKETTTPKQKEFDLTREENTNKDNDEEIFSPYIFSSKILGEGDYMFATASFLSWKNNKNNINNKYEYSLISKKNEIILGEIKYTEDKMNYIEIKTDKYNNNFGVICIPKSIPERKKIEINLENFDDFDNYNYSYLDLIKNELDEDEKYINYIQETINKGTIIFGKQDDIFDKNINHKEIKTCSCISPPNLEIENEFLNFWNCKIDSFFINNIKLPASYSIALNGEIIAIFAIEEEFIIAPSITGTEVINYYKELIDKNYDTSCELQNYTNNYTINTKMMICKSFNFAELPDFNIILDGEIYLIALSFDLFKEINDSYVYCKILINEANTREYWYLGDPIIKNYNFLFNYTSPGNETITIVQSDKYESMTIILFFCISSIITLLFYIFIIITRVRAINKENQKFQDKAKRKQSKKIKKIIKNQNDFEVPEENIPVQNINQNILFTEESKKKEISDIEEESYSDSISSFDIISKTSSKKTKKIKKGGTNLERKNAGEIEMTNIGGKINFSDEEESDLNADDEGGIQAFNKTKLKKQ